MSTDAAEIPAKRTLSDVAWLAFKWGALAGAIGGAALASLIWWLLR